MQFILRFSFAVLVLMLPCAASAQNVTVTFVVDMTGQTISPSGVHIAGSFQSEIGVPSDWDPAATIMTDANADLVYEFTAQIPVGTYFYKFINGSTWPTAEIPPASCTVGSDRNRQLVVSAGPSFSNPLPVKFNTCNVWIEFSVNMNGQTVSDSGVHVMGDFQQAAGFATNWNPASIKLQDYNEDGFYETRIQTLAGTFNYLFVNGNTIITAETVPQPCAVNDGTGIGKRTFSTGTATEKRLDYCFAACDTCNPDIVAQYPTHWWNDAVFYEIFVRSFYDSNNDGIGDFKGITQKLDYLNDGDPNTTNDLGVTALWLMPMMQSPSYHGYDVSNYYATEQDYGTTADFKELLDSAHARGIKVILDLVLNHSSRQHNYFAQSATNQNGKRDWYVWSDTVTNLNGPLGQAWHTLNGSKYYGVFYDGMPDLNYNHPLVRTEMLNVTNYWLNLGADGYRLDAIKYLVEEGNIKENAPGTFAFLEQFNQTYKATNPEAFTVGEVWDPTANIIPYVHNNRLDACFEFTLAGNILTSVNTNDPASILQQMKVMQKAYRPLQYGTFLTNHDQDRAIGLLNNNVAKMKLAATTYLTLPGIPFVYYGEELGLAGSGDDINKRKPMQWTAGTYSGFSAHAPWSSVGANYATNNVATMSGNPASLYNHYKKLIRMRNNQVALRKGYFLEVQTGNAKILSYARIYDQEAVVVVSNFGTVAVNPALSVATTSLTAGNYFVTELYNNVPLGTITIGENGSFTSWSSTGTTLAASESWMLLISVISPVSIKEKQIRNSGLLLFPNPATDQVVIRTSDSFTGKSIMEISNIQGALVLNQTFTEGMALSTANLKPGFYLVTVRSGNTQRTERLAIMR